MTSPIIYILAVILLVLFCVMAWCHEREEAAHKVTQERLEAVLKDLTGERQAFNGRLHSSWDREDALASANHAKAIIIRDLKGDKENLLEIIKDRNETIQLHKDRDTHHAEQLQAARADTATRLGFIHKAALVAKQYQADLTTERDALQVRVGQQEQALKAHEETIALHAVQLTTWKAQHDTLAIRNDNQRVIIESLRATQVTLEEARALYREGALVPRDLVTLAETIKAHLSAGLVRDADVARLGGSLSRAVQVYRKAQEQVCCKPLAAHTEGMLQEILKEHQAM